MVVDANKEEALTCMSKARTALRENNFVLAERLLKKAKSLDPGTNIDYLMSKANSGASSSSDQAPGPESSYSHDDHYEEKHDLRSRKQQHHHSASNGSVPSYNRAKDTGASSTHLNKNGNVPNAKAKSRSRSGARLGVDYTQEQLDLIERIRHCKDYYEILNVTKTANEAQLKKEYRKLALMLHPDKCRCPGSTEAFKAVGNAFATLSNKEKRERYDMYGAENSVGTSSSNRRGNNTYEWSYGGYGYDNDISPDEIFEMFFGGGYPTGSVHRRGNQRFTYTQQRENNGEQGAFPLVQFLPFLLVIFLSVIMHFLTPEPPFSLTRTDRYTDRRFTRELKFEYYVKPDFEQQYRGKIHQVDQQVDDEQIQQLRMRCYREKNQKEHLIWQARTSQSSSMWDKAQKYPTPNCDKLNSIYS